MRPRRSQGGFGLSGAVILSSALSVAAFAQTSPDQLLLKDYKPNSIFKIPETRVEKARYPVIDMQ